MGRLVGPMEADQSGFPRGAADQMNSKTGDLAQNLLAHSKGLHLSEDLHSSFLGLSAHSTFPHDCSTEDREGGAGSCQKEAGETGRFLMCRISSMLMLIYNDYFNLHNRLLLKLCVVSF